MTKDIAVTEVAQERVGEHIDQQTTECRADNGNVILNAVRCAEILDYIEYAKAKGCSMTGPEDPDILRLNVLA